jgi:hypothetical protein
MPPLTAVEKVRLQINTTKQLLNQVIALSEEVCGQLPQNYQLSPIRSFIVVRDRPLCVYCRLPVALLPPRDANPLGVQDRSQVPLHAHGGGSEDEGEGLHRRDAQQTDGVGDDEHELQQEEEADDQRTSAEGADGALPEPLTTEASTEDAVSATTTTIISEQAQNTGSASPAAEPT